MPANRLHPNVCRALVSRCQQRGPCVTGRDSARGERNQIADGMSQRVTDAALALCRSSWRRLSQR